MAVHSRKRKSPRAAAAAPRRRIESTPETDNPALDGALREGPTVAQLVELLQTAYPINWEQLLRNRLGALGNNSLISFGAIQFYLCLESSFRQPNRSAAQAARLLGEGRDSPLRSI
jgi:hypothetical protein